MWLSYIQTHWEKLADYALEILPIVIVLFITWRRLRRKASETTQTSPWIIDNQSGKAEAWQQMWSKGNLWNIVTSTHRIKENIVHGMLGVLGLVLSGLFFFGMYGCIESGEPIDGTFWTMAGIAVPFFAVSIYFLRLVWLALKPPRP